jgi:DNA-binding winged helix-turn-helix (wHTH) protein
MIDSGVQPLVNAVLLPWDLRVRLEHQYRNSDYLRLLVTDEPYRDPRVELYLLPAQLYLEYVLNQRDHLLNQVPVVCYGPPMLLENSFMSGCSDYLREPWNLDEFEVRTLRQMKNRQLVFSWGTIQFDQFRLWYQDRSQWLNAPEYRVLRTLMHYKGEMVSREKLSRSWDNDYKPRSRTLDLHVSSLRKKIDYCLPSEVRGSEIIMTIRRVGYLIR